MKIWNVFFLIIALGALSGCYYNHSTCILDKDSVYNFLGDEFDSELINKNYELKSNGDIEIQYIFYTETKSQVVYYDCRLDEGQNENSENCREGFQKEFEALIQIKDKTTNKTKAFIGPNAKGIKSNFTEASQSGKDEARKALIKKLPICKIK